MNRVPERNRPRVILVVGVVALLLVAGGILLLGQLGPSPAPSTSLPPSVMASPSADPSTPEGAVRAFFAALKEARRTDDPGGVVCGLSAVVLTGWPTCVPFGSGQPPPLVWVGSQMKNVTVPVGAPSPDWSAVTTA